jgi:hypothetical protein
MSRHAWHHMGGLQLKRSHLTYVNLPLGVRRDGTCGCWVLWTTYLPNGCAEARHLSTRPRGNQGLWDPSPCPYPTRAVLEPSIFPKGFLDYLPHPHSPTFPASQEKDRICTNVFGDPKHTPLSTTGSSNCLEICKEKKRSPIFY